MYFFIQGHSEEIVNVVFSKNDAYLASGSFDSTVCIWDTKTGK